MLVPYTKKLAWLVFSSLIPRSLSATCRPFNNLYPAPRNASSEVLIAAGEILAAATNELLQNETIQVITNSTSFSVQLYTVHDAQPIFTFHYTAPSLAESEEGVTEVDSNTIYRVASVSKALTVYTYLLAAGDGSWNDPITDYVPELAEYAANYNASNALDIVDWSSITVGSLASQLSGIARDANLGSQNDLVYQLALGLPPPAAEVPDSYFCPASPDGVFQFPCNRTAFFETNLFRPPNVSPYLTPAYTNIAYQILSYALENITGTPMADLFQTYIVDAHQLNATTYGVPNDTSSSIIPINGTAALYYDNPFDGNSYGGNFASINDLTTLGRAVLNSTFLSRAQTNRWFKPYSFLPPSVLTDSAGVYQAIGAPWEIIRAPAPLARLSGPPASANASAAESYQTWVYTKEGDFGLYAASWSLIPEFDVGMVILSAGTAPRPVVTQLEDYLTEVFVPALFEAARQETDTTYAGTYVDQATNASITLEIADASAQRQGLYITDLTFNGTDLIALLGQALFALDPGQLQLTLYPDGLTAPIGDSGTSQLEGWKAIPGIEGGDRGSAGAYSSGCFEFGGIGSLVYGGFDFAEFRVVVESGADGGRVVTEVQHPVLSLRMTRSE